jgi:hypothetical protein
MQFHVSHLMGYLYAQFILLENDYKFDGNYCKMFNMFIEFFFNYFQRPEKFFSKKNVKISKTKQFFNFPICIIGIFHVINCYLCASRSSSRLYIYCMAYLAFWKFGATSVLSPSFLILSIFIGHAYLFGPPSSTHKMWTYYDIHLSNGGNGTHWTLSSPNFISGGW